MIDGFVKSPSAALHCILCHCGVPICTPHFSGFARLASEAFYFAILILSFYDFINDWVNSNRVRCVWLQQHSMGCCHAPVFHL